MRTILIFIQEHWAAWLFALLGTGLGYVIRKMETQQKEYRALSEGVKSLLRESIVKSYNRHLDKGFCPIYAKESVRHVYEAYHNLGGNDVATKLYEKLLEMPEEPAGKYGSDGSDEEYRKGVKTL